jgi:hypothetical protein
MFKTPSPILICLTAAIVMMGVSACSFKKNPNQKSNLTGALEKNTVGPEYSIEVLFNEKDEQKIIGELITNFSKYEKDAAQSNGTILDAAIKYEKYDVVNYLVIDRGVSPFDISQNIYNILVFKPVYSDFINAHQTNKLIEILNNKNDLRSEVEINKLGQVGCQRFAQFLINEKYNHIKSKDSSTYWEVFKTLNIDDTFKVVLSDSDCSNYVEKFSAETIKSWMTAEFLFQFQHNFSSPRFLKYLASLNNEVKKNSITFIVPSINLSNEGSGTINVLFEPRTAFELKRLCVKNRFFIDEDVWRQIIYDYGYTIEEASLDYGSIAYPRGLYKLYLIASRTDLSEDEFMDQYLKVESDMTTDKSKQFVKEICGGVNEKN